MIRAGTRSLTLAFVLASLAACGGTTAGGTTTTTTSATGTGGTGGGSGTGGTGTTTGSMSTVSFSYTPGWPGVTAVDVIGGFGLSTDWSAATPLVKLTAGPSGTWTGTTELPAGQYLYLFRVTGDGDAPANYARYSVDPAVSAFAACPSQSPTYDSKNANPCSQLTVPQGAADPVNAVSGAVLYGGQPIGGYLVLIERMEPSSHHYFANRVDAASDGTYSLSVAPGTYRVQVQYPTSLSQTDTDRNPLMLKALRRVLSSGSMVKAPVALPQVDMEYLDYGALAPTGTATLPTTFQLTVIAGASKARAAVYGTMNGTGKSIGDPWWTSDYGTTTTATFDGTFNTAQATEKMVSSGEAYFWGTWQEIGAAGVWTGESMVFPIKWN